MIDPLQLQTRFNRISLRVRLLLLLSTASLVLSACGSTKPNVYQHEEFDSASTYSHNYPVSGPAICEAAQRALLSQGYVITHADEKLVKGTKSFQPENDKHVEITFNVVCVDSPNGQKVGGVTKESSARAGAHNSTIFVNALQDRYALKKVNSSASVGVGILGSVSVPFTASDDSLVKVASETIPQSGFYDRFFALVDRYIALDGTPEPKPGSETTTQTAPASSLTPPLLNPLEKP
ncbi:MAG: DUF2242 domain-containing protein [Herbaspirillum sp.]